MTTIHDVFSKKTASEVYRVILLSPGSYLFDEVDLEEKETPNLTLFLTIWHDQYVFRSWTAFTGTSR